MSAAAPWGTVGQAEQDYQLRNGRLIRLDPVQHKLPQRALDPLAPPPKPPAAMPTFAPAVNFGGNPMEVLQQMFRSADYPTYANFYSRVKKLPRTAASRVDNEKILQALRASRLVLDPGLLSQSLKMLDEKNEGNVAFVKLQNLLNQSWPPRLQTGVESEAFNTGPSPDDPHAGCGAASGQQTQFAAPPQRAVDPGMFGTAIEYGMAQPSHSQPPPMAFGTSAFAQQQIAMQQDLARLQTNRSELEAAAQQRQQWREQRLGGAATNPFPGALAAPQQMDLDHDIARLRAGGAVGGLAGANTYRPQPPAPGPPIMQPGPGYGGADMQRASAAVPEAVYRSQHPTPAYMPPPAQGPSPPPSWGGALDPSHQTPATQRQMAAAADREKKARAEERFMFQGQLSANMGFGPGPSAPELQPQPEEEAGRNRAAGVPSVRMQRAKAASAGIPWATNGRGSPEQYALGSRAGVGQTPEQRPMYQRDHLGFNEAGLTGTAAASQEFFDPLYPRHMNGMDTRSSFRADGTLRDNVSHDESAAGTVGGARRRSPDHVQYAMDNIGVGMNPEALGSQPLPFEGSFGHGNMYGRDTASSFNLDGTLKTNVSLDESNRGVTGGMNRRHNGSPVPETVPDGRRPAGRFSNRNPNSGFQYGSM